MKATLYLSYVKVKKNIDSLLNDAYKIPSKHMIKADAIPERVYIANKRKVYGTLFSVVGNAASQLQFSYRLYQKFLLVLYTSIQDHIMIQLCQLQMKKTLFI